MSYRHPAPRESTLAFTVYGSSAILDAKIGRKNEIAKELGEKILGEGRLKNNFLKVSHILTTLTTFLTYNIVYQSLISLINYIITTY